MHLTRSPFLCSYLHCLIFITSVSARSYDAPYAQYAIQDDGHSLSYDSQTNIPSSDGLRAQSSFGVEFDTPFAGLSTFANVPYVHCLSHSEDIGQYDVAFLGAPFDTATTGRPSARFGPKAIRAASWRMFPGFSYDYESGDNTFEQWAKIVDCGDAPMTFLDNNVAMKQLGEAHRRVARRTAAASFVDTTSNGTSDGQRHRKYTVPRIVTLGGDHMTTLAALRETYKHWGAVSVIHFDSHLDTWNPKVIGGPMSPYAGLNHGTFLHRAAVEGLISNSSIHAGMRGPLDGGSHDVAHDAKCGFAIVTARDLDRYGVQGVVRKIKSRVQGRVYISVDIDVLDPAFAPGTGTPEVGGWTTRELLAILDGLSGVEVPANDNAEALVRYKDGLDIIGADVVEVAPAYDNRGETTALAAAEIARTLMSLMVRRPVAP